MSKNSQELVLLRPGVVRGIVYTLYVLCAASILLELVIHRHEKLEFAEFFGFYGWFGFVACVALVIAAKGMRRLLKRPENYYGDDES